MAREKSSTPRSRIAACQRPSSMTSCSQAMNSSYIIGGWRPSTVRHDTNPAPLSDTTAS